MSYRIVKQPNGLYAMWSTIIDDFVKTDLTRAEYIYDRARECYNEKVREMDAIFKEIENGYKSSTAYTMNYNECLKIKQENNEEQT
jgi:hypothetical protein